MLISKKQTENHCKYTFRWSVGGHTTSGYIEADIYKENYIKELHKQIKNKLKGTRIKVKRKYKLADVNELNNKLSKYIQQQKEFLKQLQELPFVSEEFINIEEMHQVCDIANNNGRLGSKSCLQYKDVKEIISHFEKVLELLEEPEELISIAI